MYYLYIDESGDPGRCLDESSNAISNSSMFFTLAGIVVNDIEKKRMESAVDRVIKKYFCGIALPQKFKLHYHSLRQKKPPYNMLSDYQRKCMADDVFEIIGSYDCTMLSVTINLRGYFQRHHRQANPKAYSLLLILDRFQRFLNEIGSKDGRVIYERFHKKERKKTEFTMKWLKLSINTWSDIRQRGGIVANVDVRNYVENGEPREHPILQVADFSAYGVWVANTTAGKSTNRWDQLTRMGKYYRFNEGAFEKGNITIGDCYT